MSSWLSNSVDPIKGNDKKSEHYWKAVAQEFNSNMPSGGHKRIAKQCRTHWDGLKREVAKFSELHSKARSTFTSGYSDDMIMEKTREWYKSHNKQKPFTFEYIWRDLKDQPKWRRVLEEGSNNKRNKISESGAYTSSSNQDTEEETVCKERRPEGQKAAKARQKSKGDSPSPLGGKPCENMILFHEAMSTKAASLIKSAEAALAAEEEEKRKGEIRKRNGKGSKVQDILQDNKWVHINDVGATNEGTSTEIMKKNTTDYLQNTFPTTLYIPMTNFVGDFV